MQVYPPLPPGVNPTAVNKYHHYQLQRLNGLAVTLLFRGYDLKWADTPNTSIGLTRALSRRNNKNTVERDKTIHFGCQKSKAS